MGVLTLGLWQQLDEMPTSAPEPAVLDDNTLKVATRVSPNIYYEDELGPSGFEYMLLENFAERIDKKLEIITVDNLPELHRKLHKTEVHMASAGLSVNPELNSLQFSQPYLHSRQQVIYRAGSKRPRKIADLIGFDVLVNTDSNHAKLLEQHQQHFPELQWREATKVDYIDMLGLIESGTIDYAIVDANEFMLHRSFFPKVKVAFNLTDEEPIAWAFPEQFADSDLYRAANQYLKESTNDGTLAVLTDQVFGHVG
ncbi:transporter substrate-binding domain-containing protein, partial [bacterium]|nr:transporter substrate-binding domain-containing protein [bacterium]